MISANNKSTGRHKMKTQMSNILETVINKKELDEIRKVLKRAYAGDTVISHGKYYYSENGVDFDFRNISAGLKSFASSKECLKQVY